jgi:hypothetical protein
VQCNAFSRHTGKRLGEGWITLIGIEDAIQRGLGIQKYWQVYLLIVITEDDIKTRFIISDRGSEWIEEKAASEHPNARVAVQ